MVSWDKGKSELLFLFSFSMYKLLDAVYILNFGSMFKKRLASAAQ